LFVTNQQSPIIHLTQAALKLIYVTIMLLAATAGGILVTFGAAASRRPFVSGRPCPL
jgi:hypothetical protein